MEINTSKECVDKMLHALPFADNDAGLKETGELIKLLFEEKEKFRKLSQEYDQKISRAKFSLI